MIVITSSREDRDLDEAYRLGANSYVVKPVDFDRFSEAVGQLGLYVVQAEACALQGPVARRL